MKPLKMKPLEFDLLDVSDFHRATRNLLQETKFMDDYLSKRNERYDIIEKPDIFCDNLRSVKQEYTRFDLFCRNKNANILVCPFPMEIMEFIGKGEHIRSAIEEICSYHKNKLVIFNWNHDNDSSLYFSNISVNNYRIINYGYTKQKIKNSITVPFFNYNTKPYREQKQFFCSFIGTINNQLRYNLIKNIEQTKSFTYINNKKEEDYLKIMSSSIFSLCPRGGPNDGGFSYRFFECMHLNTIPVIISDHLIFPYPDLDWKRICLHFPEHILDDLALLEEKLKTIDIEGHMKYIHENKNRFTLGGVQEEVYKGLLGA